MMIEVWVLAALVALASMGLVTILKTVGGWVRRRSEVNKAIALMAEISGKSHSVVQAEVRELM
jgi:hypothetical protein